jgi:hypothetical protein
MLRHRPVCSDVSARLMSGIVRCFDSLSPHMSDHALELRFPLGCPNQVCIRGVQLCLPVVPVVLNCTQVGSFHVSCSSPVSPE